MRALVFDGDLTLVTDIPTPRRQPGEALIRIKLAGICNTDLEIVKGYMGYGGILGHEFVGVVEDSDSPELVGKRVVGEINISCGHCELCISGMRNHCPSRSVLGIMNHPGTMADFCTLPDSNLHIVPENLPDEGAVFCEPAAAAFEILTQTRLESGQSAIVLGDGKLGLLVAQVLKTSGAEVLLIGRHAVKLRLAERWSIRTALSGKPWTERRAHVVVDCTGSTEGFSLALDMVRPRGVVVVKTTVADLFSINLAPLVINEVTVIGSRCGPFAPALKALAERNIQVNEMISGTFPMNQALEAFEAAMQPGALKVLIRM